MFSYGNALKRAQTARTPPRKQKRDATEWSCEGLISLQLCPAFYMFLGNPGTIEAPQHTFLQNELHTATFAGHHKSGHQGHHFRKPSRTGYHRKQGKSLENVAFSRLLWRRRWDSNPRALADYLISSQARYDHFDTSPQYNYSVFGTDNTISSQSTMTASLPPLNSFSPLPPRVKLTAQRSQKIRTHEAAGERTSRKSRRLICYLIFEKMSSCCSKPASEKDRKPASSSRNALFPAPQSVC